MPEHLSNGQFAPKEVGASKLEAKRDTRFQKGRAKTGGRKPGTPNKITRDVEEFLASLVASTRVQEAVEARIEKGDAVAFFRALEHVLGKPKERHDVRGDLNITFSWKP